MRGADGFAPLPGRRLAGVSPRITGAFAALAELGPRYVVVSGRRRALLLVGATLALGLATVEAWAAGAVTGSGVSIEFILGALMTIGGALVSGYTVGVDRHLKRVEARSEQLTGQLRNEQAQQQSQINMLRDTIHAEHPSRSETELHRQFVENTLARLERRIDALMPLHPNRQG